MKITTIGIDLAKNVFHVHGVDEQHRPVLRKKLGGQKLSEFVSSLSPCLVAMESCVGAHAWARKFKSYGHEVKLIAPRFVKPFVKSNKNDMVDAEAIVEAVVRPNMRFVAVNTIEQQDIQVVHRVRERLVGQKIALMNQIRGLVLEYGVALPTGKRSIEKSLPEVLSQDCTELTTMSKSLFYELLDELRTVGEKVKEYDRKILDIHKSHPVSQRLVSIPGVGPQTATAIIASISDPSQFKNGRQFSAYMGLVPKQYSTGGKNCLLGISKRGDVYLRKLLIHGARTTLQWVENKKDSRSVWAKDLVERRGSNRAAVALANKNARIIWALLSRNECYKAA